LCLSCHIMKVYSFFFIFHYNFLSLELCLLFNAKLAIFFSHIMARTSYIQWDDDNIHFELSIKNVSFYKDYICCVMGSMFNSSVGDCGSGKTKDYKIGICFSAMYVALRSKRVEHATHYTTDVVFVVWNIFYWIQELHVSLLNTRTTCIFIEYETYMYLYWIRELHVSLLNTRTTCIFI
jgi:hypothetical protein